MKKKAQKQQRLSMKLLLKLAYEFNQDTSIKALGSGNPPVILQVFLMYVENKLKPLKP